MNERTMYESKQDLVSSAENSGVFKKAFIEQPTQVSSNEIPFFAIYPGAEKPNPTNHDAFGAQYTGPYEFEAYLVFKSDCLESDVISKFNTFMQTLVSDQKTNSRRPFVGLRWRHLKGDWQEFEVWFVEITFSRVTCEGL